MIKTTANPTEYLHSLENEFKDDLIALNKLISKVMKGKSRILWEGIFWGGSEQNIIGYGEWSYKNSSGKTVEWFIVGLAAQKNYISIYVNAVEDKQYVAEKYKSKLGKVKVGKSSISFKKLSDINQETLTEMLEKAKQLTS